MTPSVKFRTATLLCFLYTAIIGVGMYLVPIAGFTYGNPEMVTVLWWVEILLTLLAIGFTVRFFSWSEVGFGNLNIRELLWLVPTSILILHAFWILFQYADLTSFRWGLWLLVGFVTFLVGFSEELVYRGVALRAFLQSLPFFLAILLSAAFFSVLHIVNIFAGVSISGSGGQLVLTFIFGLFTAPLALRLNSLWPLIIYHWLWDFALIGGALAPEIPSNLMGFALFYHVIAGGILIWITARTWKTP